MASFFEGLLENATECVCSDSWTAKDSTQLTIHFGDHINIIERSTDDWWFGECNEQRGYVPTNYIKLRLDHFIDEFHVKTRIGMERDPDQFPDEIKKCLTTTIHKDLLQDPDYFEGYNSIKIHHEMLTDTARTKAYQAAVQSLAPYIEGKIVLDVGCGTGILSMFCAKAGAKHVYGVEASPFAFKTRKIVAANGLDGVISILHGKVEDVFLPVETVDVIISEWMGTMLITESMVCSVLYARDHYLRGYQKQKLSASPAAFRRQDTPKDIVSGSSSASSSSSNTTSDAEDGGEEEEVEEEEDDEDEDEDEEEEDEIIVMDPDDEEQNGRIRESPEEIKEEEPSLKPPPIPLDLMKGMEHRSGLMMPSHCNLYFGPIDLSDHIETKIDYFNDVYGCNMAPLREDAIELYLAHATYEVEIDGKNMLCDQGVVLKHYDMYSCSERDDLVELDRDFEFIVDHDGLFCGFAGWFDSVFNAVGQYGLGTDVIVLDTSPHCKRTHWSHTLFPLSEQIRVAKGDVICGTLSFFRNNVSIRHYRMYIECKVHGKTYRKMFFLWE